MAIRPLEAELYYTDGQIDITKIIVAFCKTSLKNEEYGYFAELRKYIQFIRHQILLPFREFFILNFTQ
jgi:hypothetical protein